MYIIKLKNRWTGNILVYPKAPETKEELDKVLPLIPYSKINWQRIIISNETNNNTGTPVN